MANSQVFSLFTKIMEAIKLNQTTTQQQFRQFIANCSGRSVPACDFVQFLVSLQIGIEGAEAEKLARYLDRRSDESFDLAFFSTSYNSFVNLYNDIAQQIGMLVNSFLLLLEKNGMKYQEFEKRLQRRSEFGLIKEATFVAECRSLLLVQDVLIYDLVRLGLDPENYDYIIIEILSDYVASYEATRNIQIIHFNKKLLLSHEKSRFFQVLIQDGAQHTDFLCDREFIDSFALFDLFNRKLPDEFSLWDAVCVLEIVQMSQPVVLPAEGPDTSQQPAARDSVDAVQFCQYLEKELTDYYQIIPQKLPQPISSQSNITNAEELHTSHSQVQAEPDSSLVGQQ